MEAPRSADQFFAETTRQTAGHAASVQEALGKFLDELGDATRSYLTSWAAVQRAGVRAGFDLQDATAQATRTVLASADQASRAVLDQWVQASQQQQAAVLSLMTAGEQAMVAWVPTDPD